MIQELKRPSKSPVLSKTLWGIGITLIPELALAIDGLLSTGVLPQNVATTLHVVGAALATLGRFFAKTRLS